MKTKTIAHCLLLMMAAGLVLAGCRKDPLNLKGLAKVKTLPVTITDAFQVTFNGEVTDEGRSKVTVRGFCWAFTVNPTFTDNCNENDLGSATFSEDVEILPDTVYYVRAYAINSAGTAYGNEINFSTTDSFPGSFIDSRDGKKYHWVKIGDQIWTAENLAYLPSVNPSLSGSETTAYYYVSGYEGNTVGEAKAAANYATYGVLYNWAASKSACPDGWHLPTDANWTALTDFLGESPGGKLKEKGDAHWESPNLGATNESKFTALPGGYRYYSGGFTHLTVVATFWTATDEGDSHAWNRQLQDNDSRVFRDYDYKSSGYSVRCLKNLN